MINFYLIVPNQYSLTIGKFLHVRINDEPEYVNSNIFLLDGKYKKSSSDNNEVIFVNNRFF